MKDKRQLALQDLLNDEVERIELGFYKWRGLKYQVVTEIQAHIHKMKIDSFIKWEYKYKFYLIRELSKDLQKKLL